MHCFSRVNQDPGSLQKASKLIFLAAIQQSAQITMTSSTLTSLFDYGVQAISYKFKKIAFLPTFLCSLFPSFSPRVMHQLALNLTDTTADTHTAVSLVQWKKGRDLIYDSDWVQTISAKTAFLLLF